LKILRLRFCNVNSISGEWIIDFSHRDYLSDGIFAICGPTGAGKSTILDAICIALYGQTPRTGKITEGSNEVMTRNTGYFFSELLFETDEGKFLSHFSQNKAKKNLNGNLQSPKHELSDYKTGIIIANKLKEVSLEIVKKTGMDFERFTRSMLLAQNSFADFLKSSGDEKAPMLEQITGTKIYSDISKKVHEINKIKKSELEIIKSELSNIILFSQQEIDDFNNVLKVKKNEEELLLKKKNILEDKLSFMKKIAENENNRENILNDIQNNKKKIIDFEPEILKLNKIIKSMNFSDEINLYKNNIEFKKNEMERLVLLENEIKNIESQIKTKEFLRVKLEEEFKKVKEEKLIVYENINKIIPIDIKLNDLNKTIFNKEKVINEEKQIVKNVKLDFDKNQHFINDLIFKIKEMGKKLNSLEIVEISEEKYTNLKILHSNNLNNYKEVNILEENSEKLKKDILDYESELKINEKNLIENSINMKEIEKEITKLNDDIINILKEKDEDFIIDFIEENKNYIRNIDNVSEIYKELNIKKEKISKNIQQTQLNSKEIENKNNELKLLEKNYNILKETVSLLEKKFILSNNIKNLKELRNNLVNGVPCPLCGSKKHPFSEKENIKVFDKEKNALEENRISMQNKLSEINNLKNKITELDNINNYLNKDNEFIQHEIITIQRKLNKINILPKNIIDENIIVFLKDLKEQKQIILKEFNEKLLNLKINKKKLYDLEENKKVFNEEYNVLDKKKSVEKKGLNNSKDLLAENLKKITDNKENITLNNQKITKSGVLLTNEILELNIYENIMSEFFNKYDDFKNTKIEKDKAENEKKLKELELVSIGKLFKNKSDNLDFIEKEVLDYKIDFENLKIQRLNIFGEKNTDEEKNRIENKFNEKDIEIKDFNNVLNEILNEIKIKKNKYEEVKIKIEKYNNEFDKIDKIINKICIDNNFKNLDELFECYFQKNEISKLNEKKELLYSESKILNSKLNDIDVNLNKFKITSEELNKSEELKNIDITNLPEEILNINNIINEINQKTGAINEKLKSDLEKKKKHCDKSNQLEKHIKVYSEFYDFNELIGSADGKKFRNFAQGLTFEIVVRYANNQLKKLSDRYLLIRDKEKPLELNIIDNYQAGIIRSTKNLSGGESFIVSLALALGLSEINSGKVSVESLFLDEGFGTLDDETMHTALNTLAAIKHSGKIIGLISHVQALKDRIPLQINVIPSKNGNSVITGSGIKGPK